MEMQIARNNYLRSARADRIGIVIPPPLPRGGFRPAPPTGRTMSVTPQQMQGLLTAHGNNVANSMAGFHINARTPSPPGGSRAPAYGSSSPYAPPSPPRQLPSAVFGVDSGATLIATTASATINVQPQQRCVPTTMTLTEIIAETFIAANLNVGVKPLLITTGNISLAQFVQNSTSPTFTRIMLTPGVLFSILVTNISGASARFIANVQAEDWDEQPY